MGFSRTILRAGLLAAVAVPLVGLVGAAWGHCEATELDRLIASDASGNKQFGAAICVDGHVAAVGAPAGGIGATDPGAAYVLRFDGDSWVEEAKLTADDGVGNDQGGISVSISGTVAVMGAYLDDDNGTDSGSAYVFRYDAGTESWSQEAKLTASDGAAGDQFGWAVAVSAEVVVVGARSKDGSAGAAYVYRYDAIGQNWDEEATLQASDAATGDFFGFSVALDGMVALIGSEHDDDGGTDSGSAYVFQYDPVGETWSEAAKLTASDAAEGDQLGRSVALDGNVAVAGAWREDGVAEDTGAAYVFRYDTDTETWGEEAKLTALDAAEGDRFGRAVDVSADYITVGAYASDGAGTSSGSAYVFHFDAGAESWNEEAKLTASDAAGYDSFGYAVAVSGRQTLIGSRYDHHSGYADAGSVYVYRGLSDCNHNDSLDTCDVADGTSDDVNTNGTPDECEPCLAQELVELAPAEPVETDEFGISVSVSDDVALVGAYRDDEGEPNAGAAYVYRFDGDVWGWEAKLTAPDPGSGDAFGMSVAVGGGVAVVGAYLDDDVANNAGSAYVFRYNPGGQVWDFEAKLTASDGEASDAFGEMVDLGEGLIVVGARGDDDADPGNSFCNSGAIYVFRYNEGTESWDQEAKLIAADIGCADQFGSAVSVSGDVIVASAPFQLGLSGSAYVFRYVEPNWVEEQKLLPYDGLNYNSVFGRAVDVAGTLALIGRWKDDDGADNTGSVYPFQYNPNTETWDQQEKLTPVDRQDDDGFGRSVAISDDQAIIGAWKSDASGENSGAAYVYGFDGQYWNEEVKLTASDGAQEDRFGFGVAIDGGVALAGASHHDTGGYNWAGAAYVFGGLTDCNYNGELDICDIAAGTSQDVDTNGVPDECELPGDCNEDLVVDLADFAVFGSCHLGPQAGLLPGCECVDLDEDGDIDLADFDLFQEGFTGSGS